MASSRWSSVDNSKGSLKPRTRKVFTYYVHTCSCSGVTLSSTKLVRPWNTLLCCCRYLRATMDRTRARHAPYAHAKATTFAPVSRAILASTCHVEVHT